MASAACAAATEKAMARVDDSALGERKVQEEGGCPSRLVSAERSRLPEERRAGSISVDVQHKPTPTPAFKSLHYT